MLTRSRTPLALLLALTSLACSKDDGGDTSAGSTSANTEASASASASAASTTDEPATGDTTTASTGSVDPNPSGTTTAEPTSAGPTTETPTAPGETTDPSAGESTAPAPTDGPGVLPGETGIDSFCRRYVECGGTYYADSQACLDETFGYWGECPSRRAALDAFGACMSELDCSEWNPDAYNPGSTPCAQQWSDLNNSPGC